MAAITGTFLFYQNCAWTCMEAGAIIVLYLNYVSLVCNYEVEEVRVWWQFFAHATHLDNFHLCYSSFCVLICGLGNVWNRTLSAAREEGLPVVLLHLVCSCGKCHPGAFLWPLQVSGFKHAKETFNWPFQYEHQHKNWLIWYLPLVMIFFLLLMKLDIINPTMS